MCVLDWEGGRVVANSINSRPLTVLVQTAVYLASHNDRLTGFRDPLSPPYRWCHTGFKEGRRKEKKKRKKSRVITSDYLYRLRLVEACQRVDSRHTHTLGFHSQILVNGAWLVFTKL